MHRHLTRATAVVADTAIKRFDRQPARRPTGHKRQKPPAGTMRPLDDVTRLDALKTHPRHPDPGHLGPLAPCPARAAPGRQPPTATPDAYRPPTAAPAQSPRGRSVTDANQAAHGAARPTPPPSDSSHDANATADERPGPGLSESKASRSPIGS